MVGMVFSAYREDWTKLSPIVYKMEKLASAITIVADQAVFTKFDAFAEQTDRDLLALTQSFRDLKKSIL
jgi:hypothetical protein